MELQLARLKRIIILLLPSLLPLPFNINIGPTFRDLHLFPISTVPVLIELPRVPDQRRCRLLSHHFLDLFRRELVLHLFIVLTLAQRAILIEDLLSLGLLVLFII